MRSLAAFQTILTLANTVRGASVPVSPWADFVRNLNDVLQSSETHPSQPSSIFSTSASPSKVEHVSATATISSDLAPQASQILDPSFNFDPKWTIEDNTIVTGEPSLPQHQTNGLSWLGTFQAETFRKYRDQSDWSIFQKLSSGGKTVSNADAYTNIQPTGKVRNYDWIVSRGVLAPDGVNRSVILVNGAFPGPTIEADWGDTISVTVHNQITGPEEGTSIHWHGFLQSGTPYEDGVPGVTQCPIAPGDTFTYTFTADLYGTSWWHAHYSAQYAAGVFGAIVVHGPIQEEVDYDIDLGPVILSDYYHKDYYSIVQQVMGSELSKVSPKSDNNLINGKGIMNCALIAESQGQDTTTGQPCTPNAGLSKFNFTQGQTYRLRLINAGAEGLQKFSIDNHDLTVIAYDFVPIKPYTTKIVTLAVGQRADIIVEANQNPYTAYWMRSTLGKCSLTNQPNGLAMVYYQNTDENSVPTTTAQIDSTDPCANDDLSTTVPYYPKTPPSEPDVTQVIDINFGFNSSGNIIWTMNNSTFRTDYNRPILPLLQQSNASTSTFPSEWNIYNFGSASSIRMVLNNLSPVSHPMHIHGHNMYVLSSSSTIQSNPIIVNPANPTRRDTQILPPNGQIVLQIDADNPGVWPLHCHIAWHVSGGLYMNVVERPNEIAKIQTPGSAKSTCMNWERWTQSQRPDQIDSGLRVRGSGWFGQLTKTMT